MKGRLIDIYGNHFDIDEVAHKVFDLINWEYKSLADFSDKDIGKQMVCIEGKPKKVYFYSHLKKIFKANHCVRLPHPETREDLVEKLPDFKEVVTELEKNAISYNMSILVKYPHFVGILKRYVGIVLDKADTHRYANANPNDIVANTRLENEFYPLLCKFTPEEQEAFYSLFITNRQEYSAGNLIDFPTLWVKTKENKDLHYLYDNPNGYEPYPHRNVILADAFDQTGAACMHSWGMDVLHLLLQYHSVRELLSDVLDYSEGELKHNIFDPAENPYAYQMEQTIRARTNEEMLVIKQLNEDTALPLDPNKGEKIRRATQKFASEEAVIGKNTAILLLKQDIIKNKGLFKTPNIFLNFIFEAINEAEECNDFMTSLKASCAKIRLNDVSWTVGDELLCQALERASELLDIWPTLSSLHELLIAEQKRRFLDIFNHEATNENNSAELRKTLNDLGQQIEDSDTETTLYDIFKTKSHFLAVTGYNQTALNQWLKARKMEVWLKRSTCQDTITDWNEWIARLHPDRAYYDLDAIDKQSAMREEYLAIHTELIKDRQDYINQGYGHTFGVKLDKLLKTVTDQFGIYSFDNISLKRNKILMNYTEEENGWAEVNSEIMEELLIFQDDYKNIKRRNDHCEAINHLIKDIKDLFSSVLDHHGKRQKVLFISIIEKIKHAYDIQEQSYISSSFTLFTRTSETFKARLQINDNKYCYPRGLKTILDKYDARFSSIKNDELSIPKTIPKKMSTR